MADIAKTRRMEGCLEFTRSRHRLGKLSRANLTNLWIERSGGIEEQTLETNPPGIPHCCRYRCSAPADAPHFVNG